MGTSSISEQNNVIFRRFFIFFFLTSIYERQDICSDHSAVQTTKISSAISNIPASLETLNLDGQFSFDDNHYAAKDFGNVYHYTPSAVLHPKSVSDLSLTIKHIYELGSASELTVAARGCGHSLHGQAQADKGIVINMRSLRQSRMQVVNAELPYVDVSGGETWINILHETLKHGLAPKSWTDYLHLTVGGTLSNGGISGQAFRHGPQINNVHELEVITGRGEIIICSEKKNTDLFYGVLGGLGQFGIITRARISLELAPQMVKWIRILYSDFYKFTKDQEHLISSENSFDYVEGFVTVNGASFLNNWRSSFSPSDQLQVSQFKSGAKTLYCLEVAKYFNLDDGDVNEKIESILSELSYIPSTLFVFELPYKEFLDRVHVSEMKLREKDLWEVPHPWLNLLVPKSQINDFAIEVFGNILSDSSNGPVLIYPIDKSKWNNNASWITPDEDIFYLVGFLSSAVPLSTGKDGLEHILFQNKEIMNFCASNNLGVKQYLPNYSSQEEWKAHFGAKWEAFACRKHAYDPLAILTPGQKIFSRAMTSL